MPRTIEHQIKILDRPATPPAPQSSPIYSRPKHYNHDLINQDDGERVNWAAMGNGTNSPQTPEKPSRTFHQHTKSSQGDEVTYGTESFERNLRYSPNEIERQHFSTRSFGNRQSLGDDGESRTNVRFEDELNPVPAHPIDHKYDNPRPFAHRTHREESSDDERWRRKGNGGNNKEVHLLHRSDHLNTTPIRIPRPKVNNGIEEATTDHRRSFPSPLSFSSSPAPVGSSPRQSWRTSSSSTSGLGQSAPPSRSGGKNAGEISGSPYATMQSNMPPMKKLIRKSRWISIHDGKPMSKFVESVQYVPAIDEPRGGGTPPGFGRQFYNSGTDKQPPPSMLWASSSSCSLSSNEADEGNPRMEPNYAKSSNHPKSSSIYVTQNPVYSAT